MTLEMIPQVDTAVQSQLEGIEDLDRLQELELRILDASSRQELLG